MELEGGGLMPHAAAVEFSDADYFEYAWVQGR